MTAGTLSVEYLDQLGEIGRNIIHRLCDDPDELFTHLVELCTTQPAQAAHLTMCLAAWIDLDTPDDILVMRARQKAAIIAWKRGQR